MGYIVCDTGCGTMGERIGDTRFKCTAFSAAEDWTMGERIFQYYVPITADYQASFTGSAWINLNLGGGGAWEVRTKLDTRIRPDTGMVNSSPVTTMAPMVRTSRGYKYQISIPWADADDDDVNCR